VAVSQIGNLRRVKGMELLNCGRHAECHSAKQQIANLRYEVIAVLACLFPPANQS
jgi:hypothetical protein